MPFTWTINPYCGCEFDAATATPATPDEFMEMHDGLDFEQKIYVKQHAAGLLRHDLRRVKPGEAIALGTATDPYQPAERRYEVTRGILKNLPATRASNLASSPSRISSLATWTFCKRVAGANKLSVHITITTLNTDLARILEPCAPRPDWARRRSRPCRAGLRVA